MTLYTLPTLRAETMKYWADITKETPKENFKLDTPKKEVERGFQAYEAGRTTSIPLIILGGPQIRTDDKLIINFGTLATATQTNEKKMRQALADITKSDENNPSVVNRKQPDIKKVVKDHLHKGSIMNDSNWWIYRNDMFMIGGIHGARSFHIADGDGEIPPDKLLWDKGAKRPTVLGRELIMLELAGYQRIDANENLGIVFAPPADGPRLLTLEQFRQRVKQVKSLDEIKAIFGSSFTNNCQRLKV